MDYRERFCVRPGTKVRLAEIDAGFKDKHESHEAAAEESAKYAAQWKISESDYAERPHWDEYMRAYEDALSPCSTEHAPWFVIPSNHKWFRNLAIARIIVEQLEDWHMSYPRPTVDLDHIRKEYHAAKHAE